MELLRSSALRANAPSEAVSSSSPVEFVVAAFGLKAAAIAGRRGAGTISFGLLDPAAWEGFTQARREAAEGAGNPVESDSYVMTSLHVLGEGEDPHGDAARDAMGHVAMALLIFAADNPAFAGALTDEENDAVQRLLARRGTTATATDRHKFLYRSPSFVG